MSRGWPTAAHICRSGTLSGRREMPSASMPAAIAPDDTTTSS